MVEKLNSVQTYKIRKLISNLANKKASPPKHFRKPKAQK